MTQILLAVAIIGATGLIGGTLLSVISALCDTGEKNERLAEIREALPGANCGACGFAGCDSYAEAVDNGTAEPGLCAPGGADTAARLSEVLGVTVETRPMTARVLCDGCTDHVDVKYQYVGMSSCAAAAMLDGGPSACHFGCIGFGDCVTACDFNAIRVENGVAAVDPEACTGCGSCAKACPKQLIQMVPKQKAAVIPCRNHQKGAAARKICKTACIGCSACVRACQSGAITVDRFLATVDPEKCTACGACITACPQKIITLR